MPAGRCRSCTSRSAKGARPSIRRPGSDPTRETRTCSRKKARNWRPNAAARMLPRMSTKWRNATLVAAGIVIGVSLSIARGVLADKPAALGQNVPWQDAQLLAEVMSQVEREYVEPVDDHRLLQAAVRGMVSSLDPYSAYLDGDDYDDIKISSSGEYSGVGIEVAMEDGQVVVVAPLDGSSAAEAGIRAGDVIATIDNVPVNTTTLADTIGRMRGKEGTTVKGGVVRQGSAEPLQFTLKRSRVQLHSVTAELAEPGYG